MITVLVIAPGEADTAGTADPAIEVLRARDAEEALEKLARNRRIDGVLLLCGPGNPALAEAIAREEPFAPPLYAPSGPPLPARVRSVAGDSTERLLAAVAADLGE